MKIEPVSRTKLTGFLAGLEAVGAAFLPKFISPVCWPIYAGLLSSMGLGFLLHGASLLILSVILPIMALLVFALRVEPESDCSGVQKLAKAKIADIEQKIQTLKTMKQVLSGMAPAWPGHGPLSECPILENF